MQDCVAAAPEPQTSPNEPKIVLSDKKNRSQIAASMPNSSFFVGRNNRSPNLPGEATSALDYRPSVQRTSRLSASGPSTARPGTSWRSTSSFLFFNISFLCCSTFLRPDHTGIRCHTVNIRSIIINEVYYLHARLIRHCISRRGASWASLTRFRNSWLKLASDPLALNNSEAHCSGCSTM